MRAAWLLQGIGFALLLATLFYLLDAPEKQTQQAITRTTSDTITTMNTSMIIRSPAFNHEEPIPSKYTCDGEDTVPPIAIDGVPDGTITLTLIMDDPDAPGGTWDHWIIYNMPGTLTRIAEDNGKGDMQGTNSWGAVGYGGPCPPSGTHRYLFKVYALDAILNLPEGARKQDVLDAMKGHVLESATLMGTYTRT